MTLLSTSERVRVWHIRLAPGERLAVHKHVLDDFWTALSAGTGRLHLHDGRTVVHTYFFGETLHSQYKKGRFMMHDLENIGASELSFFTIEFLDSENDPLPLD
ncbi:cupin domain-containing protein [Cupriavidus necator]